MENKRATGKKYKSPHTGKARIDLSLIFLLIFFFFNWDSLHARLNSHYPGLPIGAWEGDHEDCLNQHQNCHKLCNEMGHPVVNLMESQWKLRQQHDLNFPMKKKSL